MTDGQTDALVRCLNIAHKRFAHTMQCSQRLLAFGLGRYKPHGGTAGGLANSFSIDEVVLALDEWARGEMSLYAQIQPADEPSPASDDGAGPVELAKKSLPNRS